ncbi:hypothetical protein Bhyg_07810, partial [Pseudolycoriella hygida]
NLGSKQIIRSDQVAIIYTVRTELAAFLSCSNPEAFTNIDVILAPELDVEGGGVVLSAVS